MKRKYKKPVVERIPLDNTISLVMMTWQPGDGKPPHPPHPPHPHGGTFDSPFESPLN